jgi:succinate dehydrogenase/fumarate reductase cytochrome b subunit
VNWERAWRSSGIILFVFVIIAYVIYGYQPKVGAAAGSLVSFYDGDRTRILIATIPFGLAVLLLLWFAAAIRSALHDAGQGGWGAAATASSAALGGVLFVLITTSAALAYSIAGSGNDTFTSGLNGFAWVCIVVSSFPRAMLIMAGTFGPAGAPKTAPSAASRSDIPQGQLDDLRRRMAPSPGRTSRPWTTAHRAPGSRGFRSSFATGAPTTTGGSSRRG